MSGDTQERKPEAESKGMHTDIEALLAQLSPATSAVTTAAVAVPTPASPATTSAFDSPQGPPVKYLPVPGRRVDVTKALRSARASTATVARPADAAPSGETSTGRAPRQVMGKPHRPGVTAVNLSLASIDDNLLPASKKPRRSFRWR